MYAGRFKIILFADDWANYPTAIVDWETKNRTWFDLACLYQSMGVRNHAFILALVNPALKGIDPHDPNLDKRTQMAIAWECKINPWYFFREVARAPGIGTSESGPVEANRGNIALWWSFFNHITIALIQIRQTGKSFSTDVLMTYLMNVVCENTQINLVTKDDVLRRANIERMKAVASDLPLWMQQKTRLDSNNTEEITIRTLGNIYKTHVPQSSPKSAYKMGRGLTSAIMQFDEPPFQPNIRISLPAALAATGAAVDKARAAGKPYGTILTTTAGKKDDPDGKYVYDIVSCSAIWNEALFFDCKNEAELIKRVMQMSKPWPGEKTVTRAVINATFNHIQLGKSDAWLADKIARSFATGDDANRDFFNMWTSGSMTNPIPTYLLDKMRASQSDVQYNEIDPVHGYVTKWYIPENQIEWVMKSRRTIMALDTSEAIDKDAISMTLIDTETFSVIAAGMYNRTNINQFSMWLTDLVCKYENTNVIIERRSTGGAIMDHMLWWLPAKGVDPFQRLFNWVVNDRAEYPDRYREIAVPLARRDPNVYTKYKELFGFTTSGSGAQARNELYGLTLQMAAKNGADRMHDKELIAQTTALTTRNGRIDHEKGGHDDMVIAWLLSYWFLSKATNLHHYGITSNRVLSGAMTDKVVKVDQAEKDEQFRIREQIKFLYDELVKEPDELVSDRIEQKLRLLDRKLILESGEVFSLDQMIANAVEVKRSRRRSNERTVRSNTRRDEIGYMHAQAAQQGSYSAGAFGYH